MWYLEYYHIVWYSWVLFSTYYTATRMWRSGSNHTGSAQTRLKGQKGIRKLRFPEGNPDSSPGSEPDEAPRTPESRSAKLQTRITFSPWAEKFVPVPRGTHLVRTFPRRRGRSWSPTIRFL